VISQLSFLFKKKQQIKTTIQTYAL